MQEPSKAILDNMSAAERNRRLAFMRSVNSSEKKSQRNASEYPITVICPQCEQPFKIEKKKKGSDPQFCCVKHKDAWHTINLKLVIAAGRKALKLPL